MAVYRIQATSSSAWDVFDDLSTEPIASFEDKSTALTFALCLARGKVSWRLLLNGTAPSSQDAGRSTPST